MPKKRVFVVLMMMAALLSACNFPLEFGDPEEVKNAVAETVAAYEVNDDPPNGGNRETSSDEGALQLSVFRI